MAGTIISVTGLAERLDHSFWTCYFFSENKVEMPVSGSSTSNAPGSPTFITGANLLKDVEKSFYFGAIFLFSQSNSNDICWSFFLKCLHSKQSLGKQIILYLGHIGSLAFAQFLAILCGYGVVVSLE